MTKSVVKTEGYKASRIDDDTEVIRAKRYSKIQRAQHWGNLALMLTLFITGFEIYLAKFPLGGLKFTQTVHVWAGLLVFFLSFFVYLFIVLYERKLKEIFPMPRDFLDIVLILGCAFGILDDDKYPHYDYYNPEKKKYFNKYHPTQKFLATINFFMLFFIAMSGFALYDLVLPGQWPLFASIGNAVMDPILALGVSVRFIHFLVYAYFLMSTMIHFYFTMLPQNRERLRGMATGYQRIPVEFVDH